MTDMVSDQASKRQFLILSSQYKHLFS